MSNTNIYDIVISEEVARQDGTGSAAPGGGPQLLLAMDTSTIMSVNTAIQDPINVTSAIQNMPLGWEVVPNSHVISVSTYGGPAVPVPGTSNQTEVFSDDTSALPPPSAVGVTVKEYSSTVTIVEIANPANLLILPTVPNNIRLQTSNSVYFGFSVLPPTDVSQLTPTLSATFSLASNGTLQDLYISVPVTETQPVAVKDEHGLISNILDWPLQAPTIVNYNTYKFQWPIKLTGNYAHIFTLIFS